MRAQVSPLGDIVDTARLMAFYRAVESERADALFHDPFARRLAGQRGEDIARRLPMHRLSAWIVAVRTRVFDEMIVRAIEDGVDTVLNLAAGLDTRPYRLALPQALRWIEVDFADILSYKQEKLRDEQPACLLERVALNLAHQEARKMLFRRAGAEGKRVLVVSEGFLLYLAADDVAALACDLHTIPSFAYWLTALASPLMVKMLPRALSRHLAQGGVRMQFAPEEGAAFFLPSGWKTAQFLPSQEEAHRLSRELPTLWFLRRLSLLTSKGDQPTGSEAGGFLLLRRA